LSMTRITGQLVLLLLRGYKRAISPWLRPACRYVPTCSEYAMEAVERYGALRGTAMAFVRLLRCHPFATGGYDPVSDGRPRLVSRGAPEAHGQRPVPPGTGDIR